MCGSLCVDCDQCWVVALWLPLTVLPMPCVAICVQVIDEIYRVLRYVNSTRSPQRAHEVLQELRDISSMAMEYFDEKIVPILKKKLSNSDMSGRLLGVPPGMSQAARGKQRIPLGASTACV